MTQKAVPAAGPHTATQVVVTTDTQQVTVTVSKKQTRLLDWRGASHNLGFFCEEDVQLTETQTVTLTGTAATTTVTRTITPLLIKPKICNARGLPGANAFNYNANFNTDQASCIASCKTDTRCYSTGFYLVTDPSTGTSTGTCRKYDKSVTDSADLGLGYYNFNDKAC